MMLRTHENPSHKKLSSSCFTVPAAFTLKTDAVEALEALTKTTNGCVCSQLCRHEYLPGSSDLPSLLLLRKMPAACGPHGGVGRVSGVNTTLSGYNTMLPATLRHRDERCCVKEHCYYILLRIWIKGWLYSKCEMLIIVIIS